MRMGSRFFPASLESNGLDGKGEHQHARRVTFLSAPPALRIMGRSQFETRNAGCERPYIMLMNRASVGMRPGKRWRSDCLFTRLNAIEASIRTVAA